MKVISRLFVLTLTVNLAASLVSCQKAPVEEVVEATPAPVSTPEPAPIAVFTPPPTPVATPQPDWLAPEGIFYLVGPVSISNDAGITRFAPGTAVQIVAPGEYLAGETKLKLRADQVTNDTRIAQRVAGANAAALAAIRQQVAVAKADAVRTQTPVPVAQPVSRPTSAATPAKYQNPLAKPSYGQKYAF